LIPVYALNILGDPHFQDNDALRIFELYDPVRSKKYKKELLRIGFFELSKPNIETNNQRYWRDYFLTGEAHPDAPEYIKKASLIIGHAGTGIWMTAADIGKRLILFPRRYALYHEHRNEHQYDMCRSIADAGAVTIAFTEEELRAYMSAPDTVLVPTAKGTGLKELCDALRLALAGKPLPPARERLFDGIVCFGGLDYWYHNRGHYDIRLAVELSQRIPVLYINSIGMRTPSVSEGSMFWKRIKRKLKSFSRGLVRVSEKLSVISPLTFPKLHGTAFGQRFLAWQVRRAARKVGIHNPLLWVACPPAMYCIHRLKFDSFVYQRTDRMELYPGAPEEIIRHHDRTAKARADATLFCASLLLEQEGVDCRSAAFVDHGVDYERFSAAGRAAEEPGYVEPDDLKDIPRPRAGYVGCLNATTFDPELLISLAHARTDIHFVMVGPDSLPSGWCTEPNVHFLGAKSYDETPLYMAGCDVLIMPYLQNSEWIEACNPIKLKEYLAVGRPVISVPFFELRNYEGLITVARSAKEWSLALDEALLPEARSSEATARRRARVEKETWSHKAQCVLDALAERGIRPIVPQSRMSRI